MEHLEIVINNTDEIKESINYIHQEYDKISHLERTLSELTKEASKHKQLKSARENVENILNIENLARDAKKHLEENKLLDFHDCLMDMEKCKDELLEELGPADIASNNIADIRLVEEYFKPVKDLQYELKKRLFSIVSDMVKVSKMQPELLVSALRIIEREEK